MNRGTSLKKIGLMLSMSLLLGNAASVYALQPLDGMIPKKFMAAYVLGLFRMCTKEAKADHLTLKELPKVISEFSAELAAGNTGAAVGKVVAFTDDVVVGSAGKPGGLTAGESSLAFTNNNAKNAIDKTASALGGTAIEFKPISGIKPYGFVGITFAWMKSFCEKIKILNDGADFLAGKSSLSKMVFDIAPNTNA